MSSEAAESPNSRNSRQCSWAGTQPAKCWTLPADSCSADARICRRRSSVFVCPSGRQPPSRTSSQECSPDDHNLRSVSGPKPGMWQKVFWSMSNRLAADDGTVVAFAQTTSSVGSRLGCRAAELRWLCGVCLEASGASEQPRETTPPSLWYLYDVFFFERHS